jgi:spoIIIJ-associated protein
MYDGRSEAHEFVGATQSEAVAKACAFFGTDESELRVRLPETGEVYGLGARVVIVAVPLNAHGRRSAPAARPAGGRDEGPRRGAPPRRGRGDDRPGRSRDFERAPAAAVSPAREEAGPSVGTAQSALTEAGEFVKGLVERLGLGSFEIAEGEDGDLVVIQLRGGAALALASGDGRALDAAQFLVNQMALRQSESARRIVIDAEADPDGRESHLSRLADRAAQRARETGRSVALDPMNPRDRRVIHVALRDVDGVATMSVGSGRYRQVVVVPEGAPEYEEAVRQADAGNQGNG